MKFTSVILFQTHRKGSLAEEAMKIANGILSRSSSSPYPKPGKGSKDDAKVKESKKGVCSLWKALLPRNKGKALSGRQGAK